MRQHDQGASISIYFKSGAWILNVSQTFGQSDYPNERDRCGALLRCKSFMAVDTTWSFYFVKRAPTNKNTSIFTDNAWQDLHILLPHPLFLLEVVCKTGVLPILGRKTPFYLKTVKL